MGQATQPVKARRAVSPIEPATKLFWMNDFENIMKVRMAQWQAPAQHTNFIMKFPSNCQQVILAHKNSYGWSIVFWHSPRRMDGEHSARNVYLWPSTPTPGASNRRRTGTQSLQSPRLPPMFCPEVGYHRHKRTRPMDGLVHVWGWKCDTQVCDQLQQSFPQDLHFASECVICAHLTVPWQLFEEIRRYV